MGVLAWKKDVTPRVWYKVKVSTSSGGEIKFYDTPGTGKGESNLL